MPTEKPNTSQLHIKLRLSLLQHQHDYVFNSTKIFIKIKIKKLLHQCLADSQVIKQFKLKLNQT